MSARNRRGYINPPTGINDGKETHVLIIPRENEYIEKAIKKFMRKVKKAGIIDHVRKNQYYEKPSEVRKRKERRRRKAIERAKASNSTNE